MSAEPQHDAGSRPSLPRTPLALAARFYVLAVAVHGLIVFILEVPAVDVAFLRLGWWLSPWPSFPFPYDFSDYLAQPIWPPIFDSPEILGLLVLAAMFLVLAVGTLHSFSFLAAVALHRTLGWPRYWQDVRPALDWESVWVLSARRSWWIWPFGQAVWLVLDQLSFGLQYASYPIIETGEPYLILHNLAICFAFAVVSSRLLGSAILEAVDRDHARCNYCGYLLRGIESNRCPECGHERREAAYGLLRRRRGKRHGVRRLLPWAIVVVLFMARVWVPLGLARVPWKWLRYVPEALRPEWQDLRQDHNICFPIRLDVVLVIEHDGAIALVRVDKSGAHRADYRVAYWSDARDIDQNKPPDLSSSGQVKNGGGPGMPIGPWEFSYAMSAEDMFWLTSADPSYQVNVYERNDLPERFRRLDKE